jgi:LDH2 family malate/lactate/ureidoglycolate dehydrogenase
MSEKSIWENRRMMLTEPLARQLASAALCQFGFDVEECKIIVDHLIDATARGQVWGGLPRILVIADRYARKKHVRRELPVRRETAISCALDGADTLGYLAAYEATIIAIEKATAHGVGIASVNNTFYSGNLSYYIEVATRAGLVAMAAGNGDATLAPHGSRQKLLGTNPMAFGFPSLNDPVIWDASASSLTHSEVRTRQHTGSELPAGGAIDERGRPTCDPAAALRGALLPWGGHRGSGLAMVVQLLGVLAGSEPVIAKGGGFGFFIQAIRPDLLTDPEEFKQRVCSLAEAVRLSDPSAEGPPRMPYERSLANRRSRSGSWIDVPDAVYAALNAIAHGPR